MSYKILLFDLDDTLLDFGANEIDSLNILPHNCNRFRKFWAGEEIPDATNDFHTWVGNRCNRDGA